MAEGPSLYRARWSAEIIAELKRTLESKFAIAPARTAHSGSKLREHFPEAWIEGFERVIPQMMNHPKDRHVLAAAVHANARTVVTYNLRDFPVEATQPWRIVAVGPSTSSTSCTGPTAGWRTFDGSLKRDSKFCIRLCPRSST